MLTVLRVTAALAHVSGYGCLLLREWQQPGQHCLGYIVLCSGAVLALSEVVAEVCFRRPH